MPDLALAAAFLGYISSTCFVCQWLNANENLTDAERAVLRFKLKPPLDD